MNTRIAPGPDSDPIPDISPTRQGKLILELAYLGKIYRLDLTKEQRDEHIRRYAELIEARRVAPAIVVQNEPVLARGPGQPKGIARQIADETGLSKSTVRRALNPKPPVYIKPALEPEGEADAIIRERSGCVLCSPNWAAPTAIGH